MTDRDDDLEPSADEFAFDDTDEGAQDDEPKPWEVDVDLDELVSDGVALVRDTTAWARPRAIKLKAWAGMWLSLLAWITIETLRDARIRASAWVVWKVKPRERARQMWVRARMHFWLAARSPSDGGLLRRLAILINWRVRPWWSGWGDRAPLHGAVRVAGVVSAVGATTFAWWSIQWAGAAGFGAAMGLLWWAALVGAGGVAASPMFVFPAFPGFLGAIAGRVWALLMQIAHGGTVVVERESGDIELQPVWECEDGWRTRTSDGDELPVDDSKMGKWWFFPFGFVVELGSNVRELETDPEPGTGDVIQADGAGEAVPTGTVRKGMRELKPTSVADDERLVSLLPLRPQLRNAARGAFARDGRDEGLRAEGGQQQLGPLWTMMFAFLALIVGFGLVHFTL